MQRANETFFNRKLLIGWNNSLNYTIADIQDRIIKKNLSKGEEYLDYLVYNIYVNSRLL